MTTIQSALTRLRPLLLTLCGAITLAASGGCVHRIDIQQGNFLEAKDIERIAVGMTRVQVRSLGKGAPATIAGPPGRGCRRRFMKRGSP